MRAGTTLISAIAFALAAFVPLAVSAQQNPESLTQVPPVATDYVPARTDWGDPDFSGTWPFNRLNEMDYQMERAEEFGTQAWLSDEAYAERLAQARKLEESFADEWRARDTRGLTAWLESTDFGRRNSLLIDPPNGRFPALTPEAQALKDAHSDSFVEGQNFDWMQDFDVYERCVTSGFPATMFPFRENNNAVRIFQTPGFVVIQHEMMSTRIIPIIDEDAEPKRWPSVTRTWMGQGIGHWEGNTLVIETTNIIAGDGATHDVSKRAASPYVRIGGTPTSANATVVERLTMLDEGRMNYDVTYSDPDVFTAPWTARLEWTRDEGYKMYEFACHEGNVQLRYMINESRARRRDKANGVEVEDIELPYRFPPG
ncbi:hypothetical protein GRI89_05720 [Altererythrobacter salegens]|uniref:Uncharacterized protein n=1 Tax=Croceibacterium salegens TaxID=1737568 RepID=A0A6I4ST19_9SPHN|nr:hypothetical protein [Croceibacterium salegens]MXO59035.1 hypothetical protein [Croceibacterium salegens]